MGKVKKEKREGEKENRGKREGKRSEKEGNYFLFAGFGSHRKLNETF